MSSTYDERPLDRDRWMAWGGVVFLLLFAATVLLAGEDISESASGKEVIAAIGDGKDNLMVSVFLFGPGVAALALWGSYLRHALGAASGPFRRLFGLGLAIYASALAVGSILTLAMVVAVDKDMNQVAETVNVFDNAYWLPLTMGVGIMLFGAGTAVLRTGLLPRWMGLIATFVGVISLFGPGGFAGFVLGPLWIAVSGVMLAVRKAPAVSA